MTYASMNITTAAPSENEAYILAAIHVDGEGFYGGSEGEPAAVFLGSPSWRRSSLRGGVHRVDGAKNQAPIMKPTMRAGESLVIMESPMGERQELAECDEEVSGKEVE